MEGAIQKKKVFTRDFSQLSEGIIHRVLSLFETKEAVRTSIFCKIWYNAWLTCPTFNFGSCNRTIHCSKTFIRFINNTFRRYLDHKLCIVKLVLCLNFYGIGSPSYTLPSKLFEADTLRELTLSGEKVMLMRKGVGDKVMCTRLQKLHLFEINIDDEMFQDIITSCPLIENLSVKGCKGLVGINVTKLYNLTECTFWVRDCKFIEIGAPRVRVQYLKLKYLALAGTLPSATFLYNLMEKFPQLEDLRLGVCNGIKRINISSLSLKRIRLWLCDAKNLREIIIDAPSMVIFELHQLKVFPDLFLVNASSQWVSEIHTWNSSREGSHQFYKLKGILANLIQSKISVDLNSCFDDFRMNIPIHCTVEVEKLHLGVFFGTTLSDSFLDALFWTCHPKFIILSRNLGGDQSIAAFLYENLIERRYQDCPINDHGRKSWRQELKEVKIEVCNYAIGDWHPCNWNSLPWLSPGKERVRFVLEWEANLA